MKIEIGESIIYSWLRHIKKCQIVQLNWKSSFQWEHTGNFDLCTSIMEQAANKFNNPFKDNKNLAQLIKQAEIDAIGISFSTNTTYFIDVAFHENGLNYGDKNSTTQKILKKIIRTALIVELYFKNIENKEIIFVSPKIHQNTLEILTPKIQELTNFLESAGVDCKLGIICNNDFQDYILDPLTDSSADIADTSELFLRSLQLFNMFNKKAPPAKDKKDSPIVKLEDNKEIIEIEKVKSRIPRWFDKPIQNNSLILISYLNLLKTKPSISVNDLLLSCHDVNNFNNNYNQMKNFGKNNHAKVFDEINGVIKLWSPVKDFILEEFKKYEDKV